MVGRMLKRDLQDMKRRALLYQPQRLRLLYLHGRKTKTKASAGVRFWSGLHAAPMQADEM